MEASPRRTRQQSPQTLAQGLDALTPDQPVAVPIPAPGQTGVALRPLTATDREAFVDLVEDSIEHLAPWLPVLADGTKPEAFFEQEIERGHDALQTGNAVRLIALRDHQIVGSFSLTNITRAMTRQCDASWWVGRRFLRQGIARAGLAYLLRHAFLDEPNGLGLHRVMATIDPDNSPSLNLAKLFSFTRTPSEDHYLRIGPSWKKHHCYAADAFDLAAIELKPYRPIDNSLRSDRD